MISGEARDPQVSLLKKVRFGSKKWVGVNEGGEEGTRRWPARSVVRTLLEKA